MQKARIYRGIILLIIGVIIGVAACTKDPLIPEAKDVIAFTVPKGWPQPHYNFENNTLTSAGFVLGRKIFYDPRLSKDNSVSCGTCHQSYAAFANFDHALSHGVNDQLGTRNSPTLFNLNWHNGFFWDGGANHIENQPIGPIQNPLEMSETIANVVAKMDTSVVYKRLFKDAFGSDTINSQRIFKALAQFMGSMISCNSKYDHYVRKESGGDLTTSELSGLQVFRAKCATCHQEPLFSDYSYRNNGIAPTNVNDIGRGRITTDSSDYYKFKVPSLRNLKYSGPYMHDGRYTTIDEVLNHYANSADMYNYPTLDPLVKNGISLSAQEKTDLKSFLNTLNDTAFIHDIRFQLPQ